MYRSRNKIAIIIFAIISLPSSIFAWDSFKVRPIARIFLDGGAFTNTPNTFHHTIGLTEMRLGVKATADDGWYIKVDIGFANNKVSLKDVFVQKSWGERHLVRGGFTLSPFTMDQYLSTNDYSFHTGANIAETFYSGRRMLVSYIYRPENDKSNLSLGLMCGDGLNSSADVRPGVSGTARYVFRPIDRKQQLFHVGAGAMMRRPDENKDTSMRPVSFGSKGATYLGVGNVVDLAVGNTNWVAQQGAEILYQEQRWRFRAEYMAMQIKPTDGLLMSVQGGYAEVGYLIKGRNYGYDYVDAMMVRPTDPHSILLVARINCTDFNDDHAEMYGGKQWDAAIGINYHLNSIFTAKINYTQIWADGHTLVGHRTFGALQARLQIAF